MDTNQDDIAYWIYQGQTMNATHLIVVFDAVAKRNFPVYVMSHEGFEQKRKAYDTGAYNYVTDYKL